MACAFYRLSNEESVDANLDTPILPQMTPPHPYTRQPLSLLSLALKMGRHEDMRLLSNDLHIEVPILYNFCQNRSNEYNPCRVPLYHSNPGKSHPHSLSRQLRHRYGNIHTFVYPVFSYRQTQHQVKWRRQQASDL